jgi:hypothetical protein
MNENDFLDFCSKIRPLLKTYLKPDEDLTADDFNFWFDALEDLPLPVVLFGIQKHSRDTQAGKYKPKPADIRTQAMTFGDRPSSEMAWSIAVSVHVQTCYCWNNEIADAFDLCRANLNIGDAVGARNTFYKEYPRIVEHELKTNHLPEWSWIGLTKLNLFDGWSARRMCEEAKSLGLPDYALKDLGFTEALSRSNSLPLYLENKETS